MPQLRTPLLARHELIDLYRRAAASGIPISSLNHKVEQLLNRAEVTQELEASADQERTEKIKRKVPAFVRYGALTLPIFFITTGLFLVGNAVLPILNYYALTLPLLRASTLLSPIPDEQMLDVTPIVIAQAKSNEEKLIRGVSVGPIILNAELDYTNLNNWFSGGVPDSFRQPQAAAEETYLIDIPSLKIANAVITVGGTDLNKSVIHYPGTALPGEKGAPVLFGHSVLRQFYNPSEKNPRRYNSLFSTIMTMKKGEPIYLTYKGVKYTYIVQEKTEVKPEDTYILNQKYDASQLKLVTCVPEGTYLRRGVVLAQLVP